MPIFNQEEAQAKLPELIEAALKGEEILIENFSNEVVLIKLLPVKRENSKRKLGFAKGQIRLAEDFDAPLEDFQDYS